MQKGGVRKKPDHPYMHIMVKHIPRFFELQKSVKKFSQDKGVEKNNDMACGIILQSPTNEILLGYDAETENPPRKHWWKASAVTTAPTMLPKLSLSNSWRTFWFLHHIFFLNQSGNFFPGLSSLPIKQASKTVIFKVYHHITSTLIFFKFGEHWYP